MSYRYVPKVDLHVHLEGTISPAMARKLADRNGIDIPDGLIRNNSYHWDHDGTAAGNLAGFVDAYDRVASVMKTARDYIDVTYDYLTRAAIEGCIYVEMTVSVYHGMQAGLTYPEMMAAITAGYEHAKAETGIEMRCIATAVRHYGPAAALDMAQIVRDHPHPLVTGFGLAGDENAHSVIDFKPAFDEANLEYRTAHAGEAAGPDSIRAARDILGVRRFGHMVRAAEDASLMAELKELNAVPEVCVSSNIALKVFAGYADHPLRRFFDEGLKVTLGSDDPPFFATSIGHEYQIAQEEFGFTDDELLHLSRNAIEEAFIDEPTRKALLLRLN